MKFYLERNGSKIEVCDLEVEVNGVDSGFCSGYELESGRELDGDELYQLTEDYPDYICEYVMEHQGYWED